MAQRFKVQKCLTVRGKLESGVKVGRVWKTEGVYRKATAERIAQNLRVDNPDNEIRVEQVR